MLISLRVITDWGSPQFLNFPTLLLTCGILANGLSLNLVDVAAACERGLNLCSRQSPIWLDQQQATPETSPPTAQIPSQNDWPEPSGDAQAPAQATAELDELQELKEVETAIKKILPDVLPCVVAIEGGSGVIVSRDGLILTASHVAGQSGKVVKVTFPDGRQEEAVTLGTNNLTDASALKLTSPGPWPHVKIVSSSDLKRGDWCLALGYPSAFPRNRHASARLGRILKFDERELRTDCVIMGGDSGGALINLEGKLIGINSRVKNGINENFHVPSSVFLNQWTAIASSADIRQRTSPSRKRAYLGLHAESDAERVRVRTVHPNSPAQSAGLLPEDVILSFDGKRVTSFDEILASVEGRQPGEQAELIVNRYGRLLRIQLVLGSQY